MTRRRFSPLTLAGLLALAAYSPALAQPARWAPTAEDLANPAKVGIIFEGEWTTSAGRLLIERTDRERGDIDIFVGRLWPDGATAPLYLFEDLVPDAHGALTGLWRRAGSEERRAARFVLDREDGDRFAAGFDGWPLAGPDIWGRRGYEAPPASVPPAPPSPPSPPPVPAGQGEGFRPAGKFDVRLDRVEAEGRYWHVYLTLRNATTGLLVQAQGVDVRLEDSSGAGVESGQAVRAQPGPPELFGSPPPVTRPGRTLPVKFVFEKREGSRPVRIVVREGDQQAEFPFG